MSWYISNMLAGYLDFCVGILIAVLLWLYAYKEYPSFRVVCAGGVLALLPDFDIVYPILTQRTFPDHHQLPTHFPWAIIPFMGLVLGLAWGRRAVALSTLCLLWHFVHDSPPLGGGIAWAWPLSRDYWWFGGRIAHPIYGPDNPFINLWGRPSDLAIGELIAGSVALGVAALLLNMRKLSAYYPLLFAFTVIGVWVSANYIWSHQAVIALR